MIFIFVHIFVHDYNTDTNCKVCLPSRPYQLNVVQTKRTVIRSHVLRKAPSYNLRLFLFLFFPQLTYSDVRQPTFSKRFHRTWLCYASLLTSLLLVYWQCRLTTGLRCRWQTRATQCLAPMLCTDVDGQCDKLVTVSVTRDSGQNRRLNLPHLYLAPPLGVTPLEFRRDLWRQKTIESLCYCMALFAACVILRLAVVVQYRLVTDGWTDTRRQHTPR